MTGQPLDPAEPSLGAKVAFLASPAAYAGAGPVAGSVEARETHMAWVFLADDRAYKLKKPVRYPFLDYGTLEARQAICAEEVRLNRRLAPETYLGLARLTAEPDGTLAIDGTGRTVDWLVEMRRLPAERMLDRAIASGTATREAVESVADRLAGFYRAVPAADVDPAGHVAGFMRELRLSREVFAAREFNSLAERASSVLSRLDDLLHRQPQLLTDRVAAGRIVEGHGDLRPEHVCLGDPPVIIDCLEFSRPLRLVDPFDELSFLAMECAVLGADWIGPILLGRCADALDDRPRAELLAFYTGYRASLRARQAVAHLLEPAPRTPDRWVPLARRYLDQAERAVLILRPPAAPPASRSRGAGR